MCLEYHFPLKKVLSENKIHPNTFMSWITLENYLGMAYKLRRSVIFHTETSEELNLSIDHLNLQISLSNFKKEFKELPKDVLDNLDKYDLTVGFDKKGKPILHCLNDSSDYVFSCAKDLPIELNEQVVSVFRLSLFESLKKIYNK